MTHAFPPPPPKLSTTNISRYDYSTSRFDRLQQSRVNIGCTAAPGTLTGTRGVRIYKKTNLRCDDAVDHGAGHHTSTDESELGVRVRHDSFFVAAAAVLAFDVIDVQIGA